MAGTEFERSLRPLYRPPTEPVLVDVPELAWLMVDGVGAPQEDAEGPTTEFQQAIGALYPLAYTLKFTLKRELGVSPKVMPLEALWFGGDGGVLDPTLDPSEWRWRAMIVQPPEVTPDLFERALAEVLRKRPGPLLERVRLERWREGEAAQVMHIGPYAAERPTIERLLAFIAEHDFVPHGGHHEIYLGDPRQAAPEKLRTILRQAVEPAAVPTAAPALAGAR